MPVDKEGGEVKDRESPSGTLNSFWLPITPGYKREKKGLS
jgi:hypothetical protein